MPVPPENDLSFLGAVRRALEEGDSIQCSTRKDSNENIRMDWDQEKQMLVLKELQGEIRRFGEC